MPWLLMIDAGGSTASLFLLAVLRFAGQSTLLRGARGLGWPTRFGRMTGGAKQVYQAGQCITSVRSLGPKRLRLDDNVSGGCDAVVRQAKQALLDGGWQTGGADIDAQVHGTGNLVDVLAAGALSADRVPFEHRLVQTNAGGNDDHRAASADSAW